MPNSLESERAQLILGMYYFIPDIRIRVDSIIRVVTGAEELTGAHLSVYALASNAFVAFKAFLDNPLFGHGLGSHPISYDEFIPLIVSGDSLAESYYFVNKMDAGSLFFRLLSETGLVGIVAVLYFIFRFRLKSSENNKFQIISNSIFILFILQLLKQGHYFYNGLFFFVWIYYFSNKMYHAQDSKILESGSH